MKTIFNDSAWRRNHLRNSSKLTNRNMITEANAQTTTRSFKNVKDLYEDTMMGIEMAIDEPHGSPIDKRTWNKIDNEIQKQFVQMERWIKKHKAVLK